MPKKRNEPPASGAEEVAVRLLARREHSRAELEAKLRRRGFADGEAGSALDRLEAAGLLSEARFAEQLVAARLRQGYGPLRIRADLAARGVAAEGAAADFERDDAHWTALAEQARRRRFGAAVPAERHERARQARFLERRGFAAAHIARVLRAEVEEFGDN